MSHPIYPYYRFVERLSLGLVVISTDGDQTIWSQCKLRKAWECAKCDRVLRVGDTAFSPMANRSYRYQRLCASCVEVLAENG